MRQNAYVYLDWNATTPVHPQVIEVMAECAKDCCGNPSSVHWFGRIARERIEQVRAELGRYFGAHPRDVLMVSGGTEANNLALLDAPALVTSMVEHPSVTQPARELERRGRTVRWLRVERSGQIDVASVAECLDGLPTHTVVAVQAVNHETGVIQPLSEVAEITRSHDAWLHVDAVQALGCLAPDAFAHGDSFSIAAHKIRGPKGVGALLWRCGRRAPTPLMFGGSQQRGLRPGTPDPITCVGFLAAFRHAIGQIGARERLRTLRDRLEAQLRDCVEPNSAGAPRVGHVASLFVPGWRGDELVAALDVEGICVSSGSACSAGTAEPSPVILAMHGSERAQGTLRISIGESTTEDDIERALAAVRRIVLRTPR